MVRFQHHPTTPPPHHPTIPPGSGFADKKLKESLREGGAAEWTRVNLSYNPIGDEGMVPTFTALSQSHASSCPELVKLELCGSGTC